MGLNGGAPAGNTNAEKWTEETVMAVLEAIELTANDPECYYLGSALVTAKLYKDIWSFWKEKFADNDVVLLTIKRIDQIFENKLFIGGLNGKLNPALTIFGLKNNYDWKDRIETDLTTKGESINRTIPTATLPDGTILEL